MKCWEMKKCGREQGGAHEVDMGICPAYPDHAHDCWKIAGTFCGGQVQGSEAQKRGTCITCDWYKMVNPVTGTDKDIVS